MRAERAPRVRQIAIAAGALAMLIGGGHVVTWIAGVRPAHPAATIFMKTNAGLGLVLCGLALEFLVRPAPSPVRRRLAAACAAVALLLGAATFGEHLSGWDVGIDQLLAVEQQGAAATVSPNRMGLPASLSFILLGTSLLLLARSRRTNRHRGLHQPWALIVALLGLLSIIGYLYGASALYQIARVTAVAWPTALSLLLLAVGILCAEPEHGLMARVTADDPGGTIVRALLGPVVLVPLLLGWLRLSGERLHVFDAAMGTGLIILTFIVTFSSLLLFASRRVSLASEAMRDSERETRRQKDLLAVTLASIGDAVIVTDLTGAVTFLNGEAERLTGWTDSEARTRSLPEVFRIVNEETRQGVENPVEKVLRVGQVVGLANHTVLVSRDGRETPIDDSGAPIRQADGEVKGVVLVFRDITERKRAEDALRQSEERFRVAQELSPDGFLIFRPLRDHSGIVTDFLWIYENDAAARMNDTNPKEVCGKKVSEVLPHHDQSPFHTAYKEVAETGEVRVVEESSYDDDTFRHRRWFRAVAVPIGGDVAILVQDVTARKSAEEVQARLAAIVESSEDAILSKDLAGTILTWNDGAERMFGYSAAEAIGRPVAMIIPEERRREEERILERIAAGERVDHYETERITKEGVRRTVWITISPLRRDGQVIGASKIVRDITDRKRYEEAFRESETRFRTMANTIPQLAWMAKPDGFIYWYNNRWYEYTGTTPQQMEGWGWQSVHDPAVLPAVLERWKGSIASGQSFDMVFPLRGADGRLRPFLTRVQPLKDSSGRVVQWFGTNTDISEIEAVREALRESEERLRLAQEVARVGSFEWNIETGENVWSQTLEMMYGLPPGGFAKTQPGWEQLVHPEDRQAAVAKVEEALANGQPVEGEWRVIWPDGSVHWLAGRFRAFKDPAGKPVRLTGINIDITERKRAEEEVRQSEEKYRQLFEGMLEGFAYCQMVFDDHRHPTDFIYLTVNDAFARLTGLENVVGKRITEMIPGIREANPEVFEIYGRVAENGKPERFETYIPALSRWLSISVYSPRKDHFVAVFDNVTDRKRAEEEIREANARLVDADRGKNQFLAVLSHELRNPLAAVRTAVHLLEHVPPAGEHANRARRVIDRQTTQLTRLVDDLLDITRISRGKIQIQVEPVELTGLLRRTAEDHRALFATGGIDLELRVPDEPLWVDGDAQRLAQAVGNLLHNAAKFTERGGRTVALVGKDDDGRRAVITVRDTGVGISAQALPSLFQPFMQVENTLDRARGGLGLGLALVKSLVEMHGGTVSARSAGVGLGSEFTLRLPLRSAPSIESVVAESGARRRRRVLIIEDNVDAADSLRHALALAGHDVEVAYDGPEGIEKAREFAPEIVLCDIGLPGLSGYDVARALRNDAALASVRLVALTGYALPEDVAKAREAGFDLHVAKPASPERLGDALR